MKIDKNSFNRFEINNFQDPGFQRKNKILKGVNGYSGLGKVIGFLLKIFGKAVFIPTEGDKGCYLNRESLKNYLGRIQKVNEADNKDFEALKGLVGMVSSRKFGRFEFVGPVRVGPSIPISQLEKPKPKTKENIEFDSRLKSIQEAKKKWLERSEKRKLEGVSPEVKINGNPHSNWSKRWKSACQDLAVYQETPSVISIREAGGDNISSPSFYLAYNHSMDAYAILVSIRKPSTEGEQLIYSVKNLTSGEEMRLPLSVEPDGKDPLVFFSSYLLGSKVKTAEMRVPSSISEGMYATWLLEQDATYEISFPPESGMAPVNISYSFQKVGQEIREEKRPEEKPD